MNFDHPADAMLAKMTGKLNCIHCKHAPTIKLAWCDKHLRKPTTSKWLPHGYESGNDFCCEQFKLNQKDSS